MNDHMEAVDFDKPRRVKSLNDALYVCFKKRFEILVTYIACGNEQQFPRFAAQMERADEIRILRDDDKMLSDRKIIDDSIGRAIALRQFKRMKRLRSGVLK